jgi:hypothetical protein
MGDDIDAELQRARATIRALKHAPLGETAAAARARSCELIAAQQRLKQASRQVVGTVTAKNSGGPPGTSVSDDVRKVLHLVARSENALLRAVSQEMAKLQTRIAELEAAALTNGGIWKMGKPFKPGAMVTYDGVLWICQEPNSDVKPGTSKHWRLMHKSKGKWS